MITSVTWERKQSPKFRKSKSLFQDKPKEEYVSAHINQSNKLKHKEKNLKATREKQ